MADLAFVQQHNMVAYLEKNDGNADFHQILDFLTSSSINFALTQIHANVDGKAVVVSESSVRRDLHLNDEDGTACLIVNEVFENLALMGYKIASDKLTFYKVATATTSQPPKDPNTYRRTKKGQNTKVPQSGGSPKKVGDEAINEEMLDSVERAITTDASLDAAQDSDNITKTQSTVTLNEPHPQGEGSGSGPWRQETIRGAPAQTRFERVLEHQFELTANVPITPHDSPLPGGYTLGSDEGRLKLQELMTIQRKSSTSQPRRRKYRHVESSDDDLDEEDASKQGRKNDKTNPMLHERDFDGFDDETVDAATTRVSTASALVTTAGVAISTSNPRTPPTTTTVFDDEDVTIAMAQTLIKMKKEKAKEKGVAFKDVEDSSRPVRSITTLQPLLSIDPKDKGKELAHRLHEEELAEIERIQKEKESQEEVSMLQQEDREQYTIEERAKFLAETIAAQRKFRAAQRAVEIRTERKDLRRNQGLYEREQKFIHDFVPMDSKKEEKKSLEPESEGKKSKRLKRTAGSYATQKSPKKPKVMKSIENVTEEEAAEYEKEKEEFRADESSSYHGDMQAFLRRLDMQDLNDLYSCGVHTLFMDGTPMEINMLAEKKYPLIKELLEKMLNLQLEAKEETFSDSDYAGASLDRKSITGGCQILGSSLISWQCKKQTVVANLTTEAEYIAAS
ncbi:uncharacterized mitochondrial protein-like protein [Tanacetum coccineum]